MEKLCGNCKHWHEREHQRYKCKIGDCDKVPKGQNFEEKNAGVIHVYEYDGWSFEDECYDDGFNCWEEKEA